MTEQAFRLALPVRTQAPIKNSERVEFASKEWTEAGQAYLEPRLAKALAADASLKDSRVAVCETYQNAPPHLKAPDDEATFHILIENGKVDVGLGAIPNPHMRVVGDYNKGHCISTSVYEKIPDRQARMQREVNHRHGQIFDASVDFKGVPAGLLRVLGGFHDHLARRTVNNPDIGHRAKHLGVEKHIEQINEVGYTIIESAISESWVDELTADLDRLIGENAPAKVASMLLSRGPLWQDLAMLPAVHTIAQHLLGADCNLGQSLGFKKAKGADTHQFHNDPPHPICGEFCCNMTTIWALEDFTDTSGATLVVPGSHKLNTPPDSTAAEKAVKVLMPKGSVAMWHGALWHGSAIREDQGERMTIHNTYLRNIVRTFDSYLEIDPSILADNPPCITTLAGIDDLYGKNTYKGPDFRRLA